MNKYKQFIKNMPIAILCGKCELKDNKLNSCVIEEINEKALSLINIKREEIINKDIIKFLPDFVDKNFNDLRFNNNRVYTKYLPYIRCFVRVTVQYIDENYIVFYLESIIKDEFLDKIKDNNEIVFIKDRDGIYADCNEKFKKIAKFNGKSIYGLDDFKLWGDKFGKAFSESFKSFLKEGQLYNTKICKVDNDIYLIHMYAIYSENEIVGLIGICESLLGKMDKIHNQRLVKHVINDNIPDQIVYKDNDGTYLDCNESFLKFYGLNRNEVIGRKTSEITKIACLSEQIDQLERDVIICNERKIILSKIEFEGKKVNLEVIIEPFYDSYGNRLGNVILGRDVSYRAEIEKMRMEFFANVSHELRTPINVIFTSLQVINNLEGAILQGNDRLRKYFDIIGQNSRRLLKLVNNLIDTTKIDCGYYEYNPVNEDIIRFVENIAMSVADFAIYNDISLVFDTDVEEKIMAIDLEMLERIILNLLSNSIKYNKKPGKIDVVINDYDDIISITIKDTGIGIPDDKLENIFERFNQVEDRLTKTCEGSGIGLALVKSFVEIQGGTIEVKSTLGIGSEFTIKLPVKILENENILNKDKNIDMSDDLVTRMDIEFSDIYKI